MRGDEIAQLNAEGETVVSLPRVVKCATSQRVVPVAILTINEQQQDLGWLRAWHAEVTRPTKRADAHLFASTIGRHVSLPRRGPPGLRRRRPFCRPRRLDLIAADAQSHSLSGTSRCPPSAAVETHHEFQVEVIGFWSRLS